MTLSKMDSSMQRELMKTNEEIESLAGVLSQSPEDDPNVPQVLFVLAHAHKKRFDFRQELDDIHKAIEYASTVLSQTPNDSRNLPRLLSFLGGVYNQRFKRLGDMNDLVNAIEFESRAVTMISDDHPAKPWCLSSLAVSHKDRFERLGEPGDIDKAIEYDTRAVAATPKGDPALSQRLAKLGTSQMYRFMRLDDLNDLEKAIESQYHALEIAPKDSPNVPGMLINLGNSHGIRFQRLGQMNDLEKAIEYIFRALAVIPDGHPNLPTCLHNLGVSHKNRFQHLGDMDDLEKSIEYESRALVLTPDGHPHLPGILANLGSAYHNRFMRVGELEDIEKAIGYESRAVVLTPEGHQELPWWLSNLGLYHMRRFARLGEQNDLEKSHEYEARALDLTPEDHPGLRVQLANLGVSHSNQFRRLGKLDDMEKAIQYKARALALTPRDHPALPEQLANLAVSYSDRFAHLGNEADLEIAIDYHSQALALTPEGHPDFSSWLSNIASFYKKRFTHLGNANDLEKAIEYEARALAAASDDHPKLCWWHFNHALSYILYSRHSEDPSHLQQSLRHFRIAGMSLAGAPRDRFRNAREWASLASEDPALSVIEAYQTTLDLLPQVIWLGATTTQRYEDLETTETLAVDAAHAAIVSSDYSLALEWLEHARCMVWNQNLALRTPLDPLEAFHPSIAGRLKAVANELHSVGLSSREEQALSSSLTSAEEVGQRHRQLAKEYNQLLNQVHTLPGFEDFLRPVKSDRLMLAAHDGPVVVINCHHDRCDALIVLPQQASVTHVPLPSFNGQKAQTTRLELRILVESSRTGERGAERRPMPVVDQGSDFGGVLAVLWYDVVKPVLDRLGYTNNDQTDNLPHITWCPTGAMTFLPLHAAGDYDQPRSRVFDYVVSSYTPTLTALLESAPHSHNGDCRVLAVGQANTPGHAPLPGTTMELEHVKTQVQSKANYTQLIDTQANVATVLDEMERHDWVHLACHAHQNVSDAKQSGFFLHGGVLDLDAINRRSFKGKGLAFLSACQTATGDEKLPDEAVHLASGMLMAGYTSVIATMWSVHDEDAPFVADKVYGQLMNEGKLGNGEAGKALHHAVARLRDRVGDKEYSRWVPYIHIGS
ncbi:unnamed protein product [Rhizoctonia solani]|uniref:CHAT domain-containing protein n=1 Tax=Rhizoctonia solani TaxID=456999 RepID=A0A8H3I6B1_9AGAM|nr:unnamed protein product [Rhizoctonia solani]